MDSILLQKHISNGLIVLFAQQKWVAVLLGVDSSEELVKDLDIARSKT
jgi:hypothetical protein